MRPLAIVTIYNRLPETKRCLESLVPSLDSIDLVIVDNGSTEDTTEFLHWYADEHPQTRVIFIERNIGCPRALNEALKLRSPGQAVIKIDNDVILLHQDSAWVAELEDLIKSFSQFSNTTVAMVGAYYDPFDMNRVMSSPGMWRGEALHHVHPVIGHCVYHTGAFMDKVGFFDVLSPDHLYGFEDLIMSHKAAVLGMLMVTWEGWQIANIQRHSAIGSREELNSHVATMRPLYNRRVSQLSPTHYYTNSKGEPE